MRYPPKYELPELPVVEGIHYTYAGLKWNHKQQVLHPNAKETFTWAVAENPGCEEFIDGFFKYYKELGVDFIRMDFLSWYEDGNDLKFYTNTELLALNADGFVGKPLNDKLGENHEVWYGQMTNGDWVVGLFNREDKSASISVDFSALGISGEMNMRDLWKHADEGKASALTANIPAHGCKIVKLTK